MSSLPLLCGAASTVLFVVGTLPMLVKAAKTRDLSSYSLGHLGMNNVGNLLNFVYVVSLPVGPVWALHGFNTAVTALMLVWYLRYRGRPAPQPAPPPAATAGSDDHAADIASWEKEIGETLVG
jgi:hypothetical protein